MLRLRPYKACDAEAIITWTKNEYAFRQWSADRFQKYPICAKDMNVYYNNDKNNNNIFAMTAFDENSIVCGHFTMRFTDNDINKIRLGFVIVDDKKRKKGYGKEMLMLAIQYAFDILKVNKVTLAVFENNIDAIKCYKSCGFKEIQKENVESYECMGEIWNCIEMERMK